MNVEGVRRVETHETRTSGVVRGHALGPFLLDALCRHLGITPYGTTLELKEVRSSNDGSLPDIAFEIVHDELWYRRDVPTPVVDPSDRPAA